MRREFQKVVKLHPSDTKALIPIPIEIPRGTEALRMRFTYSPMKVDDLELGRELMRAKIASYAQDCEGDPSIPQAVRALWLDVSQDVERFLPLRNLLNFSLYDPKGNFRGRWDSPQYFGKWAEVGPDLSRGFLGGGLEPGEWTLELEVHALLSKEVEAVLEIEIEGNEAPRWYAGEMHTHTNHSDGRAPLAEVRKAMREHGLDFMVLSDHNTIAAHRDIPRENFNPLVIPGLEWTTFHGHAVAVGVSTYIDWRARRTDPLSDKIAAVHEQGGLVSIAHPFTVGDPFCTGCEWEYDNADPAEVDLLEIWSGSWQNHAIPNWRAITWWDELLNKGLRITGVAARDLHRLEQLDEPDTANTYVYAWACSAAEILAALKRGAVQVSVGPLADLKVTTPRGGVYSIGDSVPLYEGENRELSVSVSGLEGDGFELRVVANGEAIHRVRGYRGEETSFALSGHIDWVRVQVQRATPDETPVLITNPIYFG
mgnify:CR=1 FL=1